MKAFPSRRDATPGYSACVLVEYVKSSDELELVIEPMTMSRWSAFADLLDQGGPASRCWCVAPMGIDYRRRPVASNRADIRKAVKQGPPPGLLALRDQLAVGWCRVTPPVLWLST